MGKVISFANQKGGVGKTTVCYNLGAVLAGEMGKKILYIDVDGQGNLTLCCGYDPDQVRGVSDLLLGRDVKTKDFIIPSGIDGADLIPSNEQTYTAEIDLYRLSDRAFKLSDAIDQVKGDYDLVLLDLPPSVGALTVGGIVASNGVMLVYTTGEFSLDALNMVITTIQDVQGNKRLNINNTQILGAVLNRHRITHKRVNRIMEQELSGVTVIPRFFTPISETTEIENALFDHKPITHYNGRHKVSDQFRHLAGEVLQWLEKAS